MYLTQYTVRLVAINAVVRKDGLPIFTCFESPICIETTSTYTAMAITIFFRIIGIHIAVYKYLVTRSPKISLSAI
jgi:hypothetical protein